VSLLEVGRELAFRGKPTPHVLENDCVAGLYRTNDVHAEGAAATIASSFLKGYAPGTRVPAVTLQRINVGRQPRAVAQGEP
jgi:hypothetical protein